MLLLLLVNIMYLVTEKIIALQMSKVEKLGTVSQV